jgi:hypothetical protein
MPQRNKQRGQSLEELSLLEMSGITNHPRVRHLSVTVDRDSVVITMEILGFKEQRVARLRAALLVFMERMLAKESAGGGVKRVRQ